MTVLDDFILYDRQGRRIYPEGRNILVSKLSSMEKLKIMKSIPKTAKYLRSCLAAFWKFKLKPADTEDNKNHIGSMSLWRNHFLISVWNGGCEST